MTTLAVPRAKAAAPPTATLAVVLLVWTIAAAALAGRHIMPYPWTVAAQIWHDAPTLLQNSWVTVAIAAQGLLAGVLAVVPLAVLSVLAPFCAPIVTRIAVVVHTVPFIAIAPILIIVLPGVSARVTISALLVYFPLLISVLLGLDSADRRSLDVVAVNGGSSRTQLVKIRIPSALPAFLAGLQVAVPAGLIGALVAEFFGAVDGLGAFLIQAQTSLDAERTWAVALYVGALSTLGYALIALTAHVFVPWAGKDATVGSAVAGATRRHLRPRQAIVASVLSTLVLLGTWQALRSVLHLDDYFTKTPIDVWVFLTTDGSFWATFLPALSQTAVDSATGFAAGMVGAVILAAVIVAARPLEAALMPFAIALRSVPLVALTPLLALVFGRGLLAVSILVGLVTFFPTLVNVLVGLRSAPEPVCDLVRASGGSAFTVTRMVRLVYAIPALTASTRIAVPAAVTGATLAEWLATGKGVGHLLLAAGERGDYLTLWSSGVLIVIFVLVLYTLVGVLDRLVTRRLGLAGD